MENHIYGLKAQRCLIISNAFDSVKFRKRENRVKYFVKDWCKNQKKAKEIIRKYNTYYKSIENKLSINIKNILDGRHDTHIVKTYFTGNNYIMELDECIWGKAKIIFCNAAVKYNSNINDEYWLYDEIYKVLDKIELHISFSKSDIIIICEDAYISIEERNYFKELYLKEDFNIEVANNNKIDIANTVINKKGTCGNIMLKPWEKLIYSFIQIYIHINYYKYNNIEDKIANQYHNLSAEDKNNIYKILFSNLEENLIDNIKVLEKYKYIINEKELDNLIDKILEIYNTKGISIEYKNELYLNLENQIIFNCNNIYKRILQCIDENLIY